MKVTGRYTFESAHRLVDPRLTAEENASLYGPCARTHGHTYRLEVTLCGERLEHGMLINFSDLDAIVRQRVVAHLDHRLVNDAPDLGPGPTTAEEMVRWIGRRLRTCFGADTQYPRVRLESVTVHEGERFSATVEGDELVGEGQASAP